jgi:SAM-dependent methyltransferase
VKTWSTPVQAGKSNPVPCGSCGASSFKKALGCEGFGYVSCKVCGLVQMNPQPAAEEVIARYNSKFGNEYLSYELENESAFLKLQQLALKDAGFEKLEKTLLLRSDDVPAVLDAGCATGSLLVFLRDRGWRVTGVEISPGAEYARNVRLLDVKSLPLEENKFPADSFDVVLVSHLIEHLNNPQFFLAEAFRILKNGGFLFITTPNICGFQARLFGNRWRSAIFDHLYLFSAHSLTAMLKKNGFMPEKTATWGGLAAGFAPLWMKKIADFFAKRLGFGDVMIIRAKKLFPVSF